MNVLDGEGNLLQGLTHELAGCTELACRRESPARKGSSAACRTRSAAAAAEARSGALRTGGTGRGSLERHEGARRTRCAHPGANHGCVGLEVSGRARRAVGRTICRDGVSPRPHEPLSADARIGTAHSRCTISCSSWWFRPQMYPLLLETRLSFRDCEMSRCLRVHTWREGCTTLEPHSQTPPGAAGDVCSAGGIARHVVTRGAAIAGGSARR